ncbi:hypothetical protein GGR50DRAFT_682488 [Xylaria sp. CBS 124048]|nr:hypothetical protein GGR50DRAFT_682488 [Xylaria sp. CBS 124048]
MAENDQVLQWIKSTEFTLAPAVDTHVWGDEEGDDGATEAQPHRRPLKRARIESPSTDSSYLYPEPPVADQATQTMGLDDDDDWTSTPEVEPLRKNTTDYLSALETPVHIEPWDLETFKQDPGWTSVERLYEGIMKSKQLCGVVPGEIRDMFTTLHGDLFKPAASAHYFRAPSGSSSSKDVYGFTACDRAKIELLLLEDVQQEASLSELYARQECGWMTNVYAPLLRHVYEGDVRAEAIMTATIELDSIPLIKTTRDGPGTLSIAISDESSISLAQSRSNIKLIDYVLVVDLPKDCPLEKSIHDLIMKDAGNGRPHVNQTGYLSIHESLIAASIVAEQTSSGVDPLIQLGIWIAAWEKRMRSLRDKVYVTKTAGLLGKPLHQEIRKYEAGKRLITVPLIIITGDDWKMYFASFNEVNITLHGPLFIGYTGTILQVYALVASLRAIAVWIRTEFKPAMEAWFMC